MERHALQYLIESTIGERFADVEVVDVEIRGGRSPIVTVYIDRPGGVDFGVCAAVTQALDVLRDRYTLEVSSPGLDRPLRKRAHFERALGERVSIKTTEPLDGRSVFRGRLTAAGVERVTLTLDEGPQAVIPYEAVGRARVIYNFDDNGGQRE